MEICVNELNSFRSIGIYIYIFSEIEYNNFSDLNGESLDRERGTEGRCSVSGAVKKQY